MNLITRLARLAKISNETKPSRSAKPIMGESDSERQSETYTNYGLSENYLAIYEASQYVKEPIDLTSELAAKAPLEITWKSTEGNDPGELEDIIAQDFLERFNEIGGQTLIAFMARHMMIDGCFAAEIVFDADYLPIFLAKLEAGSLNYVIENHQLQGFMYTQYDGKVISYNRNKVYYVAKTPVGQLWRGRPALSTIGTSLDELEDLNTDLRETARKMWRKSFVFEVDDTEMTDEESTAFMTKLNELEPGKSISLNQEVKATEIKMQGDLAALLEAISEKRLEIENSFGLPKVLGTSSKSADMGTLRPALALFYDMKVAPLQRDIARELTHRMLRPYALAIGSTCIPTLSSARISLEEYSKVVQSVVQLYDDELIDEMQANHMLGL